MKKVFLILFTFGYSVSAFCQGSDSTHSFEVGYRYYFETISDGSPNDIYTGTHQINYDGSSLKVNGQSFLVGYNYESRLVYLPISVSLNKWNYDLSMKRTVRVIDGTSSPINTYMIEHESTNTYLGMSFGFGLNFDWWALNIRPIITMNPELLLSSKNNTLNIVRHENDELAPTTLTPEEFVQSDLSSNSFIRLIQPSVGLIIAPQLNEHLELKLQCNYTPFQKWRYSAIDDNLTNDKRTIYYSANGFFNLQFGLVYIF